MAITITATATDTLGVRASATVTAVQAAGIPGGPYPGQAGNLVGYQHTPASPPSPWVAGQWTAPAWPGAYPGSLVPAPTNAPVGGTAAHPQVIAFQTFTGRVTIKNPYVLFVGCQFRGGLGDILVYGGVGGYHVGLFYCTLMPSAVSAVPNANWPSSTANTGLGNTDQAGPTAYQISHSQGYDYGIATTVATTWQDWIIDHCDIWGFADAIDLASALDNPDVVGPVLTQNCWVHDPRCSNNQANAGDHTDGIGALFNSLPANWMVNHNTISGPGNTSAIAMQGNGASGLTIINNYLSGWNHLFQTTFPPFGTVTNGLLMGNLIGTDCVFLGNYDMSGTWTLATHNSLWRNNRLYVVPGYVSSWGTSQSFPPWTPSMNGWYLWPDTSWHPTDWTS